MVKIESDIIKKIGVWHVLIPVFAFLLYANTLPFGYNGDDDAVTRGNRFVLQGIKGIPDILTSGFYDGSIPFDKLYRPVPLIHFAIENEIWGDAPHIAHWFNAMYYSVLCLLLFLFLINLFSSNNAASLALITLLFAAHPVHTEVVANIKSRDEIFCLLFLMIALLALVRYVQTHNWMLIPACCAGYALSLLSKENAITFLALAPFTVYFKQKFFNKLLWLKLLAPIAAVTIIYVGARFLILGTLTNTNLDIIDNSLITADNPGELFATVSVIHMKYLQLLFFPVVLSSDYSYNQIPIVNFGSPIALFSLLFHLLLFAYSCFTFKKKNPIAYAILFYFITLSISSNLIFKIASPLAERFLFAPSVGFCVALFFVTQLGLNRIQNARVRKGLAFFLYASVLSAFSFKTINQNLVWKDPVSLYSHTVEASPQCARARLCLADEFVVQALNETDPNKQVSLAEKAIGNYKSSLAIYPEYGRAFIEMGGAYLLLGRTDSAMFFFNKVKATDKDYQKAIFYIGDAYFIEGLKDSALIYYLKVTPHDFIFGRACIKIALIYEEKSQYYKALEYLKKVHIENPFYGEACLNTGRIYLHLRMPDPALKYFLLVPGHDAFFGNACNNAGNIYFSNHEIENAIASYGKVKPKHRMDYRDALFFTGRIYSSQGNEKAISYFQKAITADPNFTPAYEALGKLYRTLGEEEKAKYYLERVNP